MMNFPQFEQDYRPAPISDEIMGIVKDTENVARLEIKYQCKLVGFSCKWSDAYRVQVWRNGRWEGTYPMTAEDLQVI